MSRKDLRIIASLIPKNSKVIDLGCGEGELLELLQEKKVIGYGIEHNPDAIERCLERGLNVIGADISQGIEHFHINADVVVMSLTLQQMHRPEKTLIEMLNVSDRCIISLPNFGHWRVRCALFFGGKMPVTKQLSYQWYDTPNVRFCTLKDFEKMLKNHDISIIKRKLLSSRFLTCALKWLWPNVFSQTAIYILSKRKCD